MTTIFEKENQYSIQMTHIREIVLRFAQEKKWNPLRRGRLAHASIYGAVNGLNGVIDIKMKLIDWDRMPSSLDDDYPFELFSSAHTEDEEQRLFSDRALFWEVPFCDLGKYVPRFLNESWEMLSNLRPINFGVFWTPSLKPNYPPSFGPPQIKP